MLAAIQSARRSVALETYIYSESEIGRRFRDALIQCAQKGRHVRVLVDAFGSMSLPADFWSPLIEVGGEFRWFNPLDLRRPGVRDHRKLLVCDRRVALIGGFNISAAAEGDGVQRGWRDLGLRLIGPLAEDLATAFDEIFALAEFRRQRFMRLRKSHAKKTVAGRGGTLLLSGPGRGLSPFRLALLRDLMKAGEVNIVAAYFLPNRRIHRALASLARSGLKVQLMLPGISDVRMMKLAAQSFYQRLLRAGVEIYEYQPQILHSKMIIVDEAVYLGSANLDTRSLYLNYELQVRWEDRELAKEARAIFKSDLRWCHRIDPKAWRRSRTWWDKLKERFAFWMLARVDPYVFWWQIGSKR